MFLGEHSILLSESTMTKTTLATHYTTLSCVCSEEKQNKIYESPFSSYQYISSTRILFFHFAGGALKLVL